MESLKLIIDGIKQSNPANEKDNSLLEIKHSFMMNGSVRGISERHEIDIKDDEIVEFIFEDNTTWLCDNFTIAELFPEQMAATNRSADGGLGGFVVPLNLPQNDSNQRNLLDTIALKVLNIFVNKAIEEKVADLAIDFENKQLENNKGLFKLDKNFELQTYNPKDDSQPYFLFIHGTFSSTEGSFGDLKNSEIWKFIQQNYGERVLAFQHETLSKSPLQNVVDLIDKFPENIVLHIISHSRGGLIGDILSTYAHRSTDEGGFTKEHIELLKKENRQDDLVAIEFIDKIFKKKNIQVKKFIRVACPAGGTILASNRMGNFFNVSANLLGLALGSFSNPIFVALKNLLSAIINSKDNVEVLPGLEAQNPDSVFIKILNDSRGGIGINDNLIVISSNAETSFTLKGLAVITSKIFFSQRNDLVVNTDSMYMGVKRLGNIQYYFDEETKIDHISYFKTANTLSKLLIALKTPAGEIIPEFKIVAQNEVPSTDRNFIHDILGLENGELSSGKVLGKKPIVVLLPGIMGSSLKRNNNDLIWIDYLDFAAGNLELLDINATNITAPSIIKSSYQKLFDKLSDTYDVVTFSFDWRLSLNSSAEKLSEKITELLKHQQPIKIVAHSMGGVLFRDFIINYPTVWDKLKNTIDFKALFLGTPFGGAFRIPAVLMGDDAIIKSLTKIDIFHTKLDLLKIFSQFPGVLCLLPLTTEGRHDFSKMEVWNELKSASNQTDLTLPSKSDLLEFGKYRDRILKERDHIDYSDMVYIAGKADATPYDYQVNKFSNKENSKELVFLGTSEGDQSVTWESGIPKQMIEKNAVYYVNVTHGALANEPDLFQGIEEILIKGSTNIFSKSRPQLRGGNVNSPMPAITNFDLSKAGIEATIMGTGLKNPPLSNQITIKVKVSNGDLMYSQYPLLAAHFKNDGILNAEKAIDGYLNKILTMRHQLNLYPSEIGTSEIFVSHNEYSHSAFKGAIIVGLGKFGELTRTLLAQTIEQGVSNYLLKLMLEKHENSTPEVGISALLVGCSYGGLSVENSVLSVVEGVRNANEKMKSMYKNDAMSINEIEFVERYEDRALSCYYALAKMANSEDRSLKITLSNNTIKRLLGSKKRIVLDNVEEWWNRITVLKKHTDNIEDIPELTFSASSRGAREDEKPLFTNTPVLDQMISKISVQNKWSEDLAKTIFELLIPNDFKEQLKKKSSIAWILDKETAAYPWELLQDTENNSKPFCINAGMVRQLRTGDSRQTVNLVTENRALVIGDPDLEGFVNQLSGALKEGEMVAELLVNNNFIQTTKLLRKPAYEVIRGLFADKYKIIHLAGHGVFNEKNPKKSGMVIGKDLFLTTFEIAQMSTVPEFVFVNCCFLGSISGAAEAYYQNRYKLAASIGTQLIENGVKAVIVAGWAVNDDAALSFAKEFYENMFKGHNFGESVLRARNKIYSKTDNTWGAYHCYGDQFYKFSYNSPNQKFTPNYVIAEEAEIALSNLENALETGNFPYGNPIDSLTTISRAVEIAGLRTPQITEAEARIYAELGEYSMAFKKYESLLKEEKASFSVKAVEKYCNIWTKMCVLDCNDLKLKNYEVELVIAKGKSLIAIDKAIVILNGLLDLQHTSERYNLLGSAYKRKAYLTDSVDVQGKIDAYTKSQENYRLAYEKNPNTYSLTNWLTFNYVLSDRKKLTDEDKHLKKAKENLNKSFNEMDFWNLAYDSNIKLCEMIIAIQLPKKKSLKYETPEKEIIDSYKKLWKMAGTKGKKIGEIEHLQIIEDVAKLKGMQDVEAMVRSIIEQFKNII